MKRLFLLILVIAMVSAVGAVPNVVSGADDEKASLLTPEEQAFMGNLLKLNTDIAYACEQFNEMIDWTLRGELDIESVYIGFPAALPCEIKSSPAVFEKARTKWNSEICPAYVSLRNKIYSCFGNAAEHPDWTITRSQLKDCLRILKSECTELPNRAWAVYDMSRDIEFELTEKRKEVQEQAKPLIEEAKGLLKDDNKNSKDNKDNKDSGDLFDTDCFIATAAYGTPKAVEIDELRRFRDEFLRKSAPGNEFIKFYYNNSPPIAIFISEHEVLRFAVREGFVAPIVKLVQLTEIWWED